MDLLVHWVDQVCSLLYSQCSVACHFTTGAVIDKLYKPFSDESGI